MNLQWYDIVGMIGTAMIIGAFFLLQARRLSGTSIVYQLLNLVGAACVLATLLDTFNLSVFVLEVTWIFISAYGIWRTLRQRGETPPAA